MGPIHRAWGWAIYRGNAERGERTRVNVAGGFRVAHMCKDLQVMQVKESKTKKKAGKYACRNVST